MPRIQTLLVATCLVAVALVSLAPSASATIACTPLPSGGGGLVGRTIDYVAALEYAVCSETVSYAGYLCVVVFGPVFCASIA